VGQDHARSAGNQTEVPGGGDSLSGNGRPKERYFDKGKSRAEDVYRRNNSTTKSNQS